MIIVHRKPIVIGVDTIQTYDIRYYTVFALEVLLYIHVVTYVLLVFCRFLCI